MVNNNEKDQSNSKEQNQKIEAGKDISAERDPVKPQEEKPKEV